MDRNEQTAGILMKIGVTGEISLMQDKYDPMELISRDDGVSWEVAFDFPVYAVYLDFGNIIIAIPESSPPNGWSLKKFFFSLDQGNNRREHHFQGPRLGHHIQIDNWSLNVLIDLGKEKDLKSPEYIFYTLDFSERIEGRSCRDED